ncbi:GNAT family N-acetyltransferase [Rhizobium sp. L245/93]|nr:GNAT family N-acetyltransferase [Rhizobium sp. L245/93]
MLQQAEGWARERGCVGVWLDTFSFQAPGFYEKQGYTVFGVLDHYPGEMQRFFLRKML